MNVNELISKKLNINLEKINKAVELFDDGCTVPFVARYRKEVTGHLDDIQLRDISEKLTYYRNLEDRTKTVLNSISEQGKLTDELKIAIENVETISELEDLYRPFKQKRKTRGSIAKEKGLERLALYFYKGKKSSNHNDFVHQFVNPEKGVNSDEEAINGAFDIIAEDISDVANFRKIIKRYIWKNGNICSKEIKKDERDTYGIYANFSNPINRIKPYQTLAIFRGEKLDFLKVKFDYEVDYLIEVISDKYTKYNDFSDLFIIAIKDSLKRLILPSIESEIRNDLFEKAQDASLETFKRNLTSLLLYPPLKNKVVLAIDPGIRTGCKYALVNELGMPQKIGVVYLTSSNEHEVNIAMEQIKSILISNNIDYIAIGNGTGSRETDTKLQKIIRDNQIKAKIVFVDESGASVYSASDVARQEFPNLPVEKRSAISLARRLQDPLSELVKIEPKSIGVGQYQHDMDQTKLEESLNGVVEDCVNKVGVNLNNCSISLLKYVSGINLTCANNIYNFIKENGLFATREELKKVPKLGPKTFEQCAGFLRIFGGKEPLDCTSIHPEHYSTAKYILNLTKIDILNDTKEVKVDKLKNLDRNVIMKACNVGEFTLDDIIIEILKPGRDIRDDVQIAEVDNNVKDIKDLKIGMILNGTVRNIMDFGLFIDINVHDNGLVHISEVSDQYVKKLDELYKINDIVKVKVIGLDIDKRRISLSIKQAK